MKKRSVPKYILVSADLDADAVEKALRDAKVVDAKGMKSMKMGKGHLKVCETSGRKANIEIFQEIAVGLADLTETQRRKVESVSGVFSLPNCLRHTMGLATARYSSAGELMHGGQSDGHLERGSHAGLGGGPATSGIQGGSSRKVFGGSSRKVFGGSSRKPFGGGSRKAFGNDFPSGLASYLTGQHDVLSGILSVISDVNAGPGVRGLDGEFVDSAHRTWGLQAMGIDEAYSGGDGEGVRVAVLDTGLDTSHPDFAEKEIPESRRRNFLADASDPGDVLDGHGHGTHCCGTVAGPTKMTDGNLRYSVAPGSELLVGKVMDDEGDGYDSEIIAGIQWAATEGAKVISLSLGGSRDPGEAYSAAYESIAQTLLEKFETLLVAATGNDSEHSSGMVAPVGNPAACPQFLAVGAIDPMGEIADFSNAQIDRAGIVNFVAPGVDVFSSDTGGGYAIMSGTSMATPHVAGMAALYFQRYPELRAHDIWHRLEYEAQVLGRPLNFGRGMPMVP